MQNLKQKLSSIRPDDLIFIFVAGTFFLLPTGTAPPLIFIGIATLIWLISGKFLHIKSIVKQPWFYPVIPFLILPWIGLLYSQNFDLGMDYALKTKYWIVLLITASMALDKKRVEILIKSLWAGLLIGAFLALIQVIGFMAPIREGHPGFGIVHTLVSMYLIIGILTASFYFKNAETLKGRISLLFLILMFIFHLAALKGRSGYLIFGMVSPIVANNLMDRFSLKFKTIACIIIASSIIASPIVRKVANNTFSELSKNKDKALKGEYIDQLPRFYITYEALIIFIENPFLGIGTGSLTEPTKARGHMVVHPHNNILYMGVSFGFLGVLACLWLFGVMLKISWGTRASGLGAFVFYVCLVLFIGGMFDTQILNTGTLLLLSMSYGMVNHLSPDNE